MTLGIIPARYASTRFPGKPLIDIKGKTMIQRVYEQCKSCPALHEVIVATDDERIYDHVLSFGGKVEMTAADHLNGTTRCAEVAAKHPEFDVVINIQGDEPFIDPEQIAALAACFDDPETELASMYKRIDSREAIFNPNVVKVVLNKQQEAMLFSRSAIPHLRNTPEEEWLQQQAFYYHIGIYGFKSRILTELIKLKPSPLELCESLEQLRWLENGYRIRMAETFKETLAIDTPEDLEKIINRK